MKSVVDVYLGGGPRLVGRARFSMRRGQVSTTFVYDDAYLAWSGAFAIDPALPLVRSVGYTAGLPGAFADAAPDRWGRRLIRRGAAHSLDEVDYLLGVDDHTREGALRFKEPDVPAFCAEGARVPPVVQLPRLLSACRTVLTEEDAAEEVKCLLEAGSSTLGGARPKATVVDGDVLYVAKFPAPSDGHSVMAWEKTSLDLACACGLKTPDSRLVRIGEEPVLLVRRFDRMGEGRVPYLSAMSLLGAHDGEGRDYVEIGEALATFVHDPSRDLRELFTRMVFSVAVNNVDDHLRNHGFVRREDRWELSPLFDVNPNPEVAAKRATAIYGETGAGQARALCEAAPFFGLRAEGARLAVGNVLKVTAGWRAVARRNGCPESEQRRFGAVFERRAQELRDAFGL